MTLDEQTKKTLGVGLFIAIFIIVGFGYFHLQILQDHYKRNENQKKPSMKKSKN